jgi:transposase
MFVGYEQGPPARPIRQLWEAPVFTERTSIGLDVHARSVAGAAIDGVTGELFHVKLTPSLAAMPGSRRCRVRLR